MDSVVHQEDIQESELTKTVTKIKPSFGAASCLFTSECLGLRQLSPHLALAIKARLKSNQRYMSIQSSESGPS